MDLIMLTLLNAQERTRDDFINLFASADKRFRFLGVSRPKNCRMSIVEAVWEGEDFGGEAPTHIIEHVQKPVKNEPDVAATRPVDQDDAPATEPALHQGDSPQSEHLEEVAVSEPTATAFGRKVVQGDVASMMKPVDEPPTSGTGTESFHCHLSRRGKCQRSEESGR
jgi:hypothetical protein